MSGWPSYSVIYQINTWAWLRGVSTNCGDSVDLGTVPEREWDGLGSRVFDHFWLMGVCQVALVRPGGRAP